MAAFPKQVIFRIRRTDRQMRKSSQVNLRTSLHLVNMCKQQRPLSPRHFITHLSDCTFIVGTFLVSPLSGFLLTERIY